MTNLDEVNFPFEILGQALNNGMYYVRSCIGEGSFGRTFLVDDTFSSTRKVLKIVFNRDRHIREQIELMRRLNHPNIVLFFDHFKTDFLIYNIVSEFCDRGSLRRVIDESKSKNQTISRIDMLDWSIAILEGLVYLHSQNIIHLNLKPENLLLDTTSLIKITDLSLSKDNVTGLFSLATNKSLHYLSPELCREELYSDNTDVWSFGCIVYELLTLTHTFTGSNSFEIIKTILNDEPELAVSNSTETFEFILKNSIVKDKKTRMTSFQMLKSLVTNDDEEKYTCHRILNGHKWSVYSLKFSQNGNLISSSLDETIKIWNHENGELLRTLTSEQNDIILSLALDNENHLFTGSFNGLISVWNLDTGGCVRSFRGHEEKINALLFTKSSHLASGSADHEIKLWNALSLTDNSIATLRGHEKSVLCLAVGKSDEELISGSADFTIRLWNLSTSECVRTLYGHEGIVRTITVGKSGELYSGSNDKSIKVWSLDKGENDECVKTLIDHNESVTALALIGQNELASASADGFVKVWDLTNDKRTRTLEGHHKGVLSLVVGTNGELITGGEDQTIRVWKK